MPRLPPANTARIAEHSRARDSTRNTDMQHKKSSSRRSGRHSRRDQRQDWRSNRSRSSSTSSKGKDDPAPPLPPPPAEEEEEDEEPKDDRFYHTWDKFTKKAPLPSRSKIQVLDDDNDGKHARASGRNKHGLSSRENAADSFGEAAATCRTKVDAIVAECRRLNKKYHDPMFNLNNPYATLPSLTGLVNEAPQFIGRKGMEAVADVKRVGDIFEKPEFFIDGATADDIRQGYFVGDCWFLASVTALLGMPKSLERICVARDEQVGVYGFCFHRDGEWVSVVVDDRLCLRYHENQRHTLFTADTDGSKFESPLPKKFRESLPKGSDALYFSSCRNENETWLPLLEKAYAKAHLSYQSIEGGFTGEGIEDLTGGVNTTTKSEDILDKDKLWAELEKVNKEFLFGCGSRRALYADQQDEETRGVITSHAYTVLRAKTIKHTVVEKSKGKETKSEEKTSRLLKIRNPWGMGEWTGAWSDGSKEWTAETLKELDHSFGDDGIFWISLDDFLKEYPRLDRTRLFGPGWTVAQQWTTVSVPRTINYIDTTYLSTSFNVHVTKPGPVTFVLSQPDTRYFMALKGRYEFDLHFRVYRADDENYLIRSMSGTASGRSVSAELDCEPGDYIVRLKLTPYRYDSAWTAAKVMRGFEKYGTEKILAVGKMFDLAHSRGRLREIELSEQKRMKHTARDKKNTEQRAIRKLQKDRRHKDKMKQQRIARQLRRRAETQRAERKAKKASADDPAPADGAPPEANAEGVKEASDEPAVDGGKEVGEAEEQTTPANGDLVELALRTKTEEAASSDDAVVVQRNSGPDSAEKNDESEDKKDAEGESTTQDQQSEGGNDEGQPPPTEPAEPTAAEDVQNGRSDSVVVIADAAEDAADNIEWHEAASDFGSVVDDDFSWDSEIDGEIDSSEYDVPSDDSEGELFGDEDWFALATIGLRIYSIDPDVSIKVEREAPTDSAEALSRATTM